MSRAFLNRNPHLTERFRNWRYRAGEKEWLLKGGEVPPNAILDERGYARRHKLWKCGQYVKQNAGQIAGRTLFLYAVFVDTKAFFEAEDKSGELARITGGWTGAYAGGVIGFQTGAAVAAIGGQSGPQFLAPEEVVTVPVGAVIGGFIGGVAGYMQGSVAGHHYYQFIQEGLSGEQ